MRLALRLALLLSIAAQAMGKGAGAWLDAHHYKPGSFAGLRFIAEDPPHVLNVVGTDDGRVRQNVEDVIALTELK